MVVIIKKLIPVYPSTDSVPKSYLNLRKAVHVASFKQLYPNIPDILVREYGLTPNEKIVVFWTKEISLPHFNRYRLKFRKIYAGPMAEFGNYIKSVIRERKEEKKKSVLGEPRSAPWTRPLLFRVLLWFILE